MVGVPLVLLSGLTDRIGYIRGKSEMQARAESLQVERDSLRNCCDSLSRPGAVWDSLVVTYCALRNPPVKHLTPWAVQEMVDIYLRCLGYGAVEVPLAEWRKMTGRR